jgi:hypothetical protein
MPALASFRVGQSGSPRSRFLDRLRRSWHNHRVFGQCYHRRQPDCKCRAATRLALDHDVPAHHLTEPTADSEAEACATVFARRGGGSLGKLLEQPTHLFRRHADTGVGHRERDPVAPVLLSLTRLNADGAAVAKLVGRTFGEGPLWLFRANADSCSAAKASLLIHFMLRCARGTVLATSPSRRELTRTAGIYLCQYQATYKLTAAMRCDSERSTAKA